MRRFKSPTVLLSVLYATYTIPSCLANDTGETNSTNVFYSALQPCPAACAGPPNNWTVYTSLERLEVCEQPILLEFAVDNPLEEPSTPVKLFACTAGNAGDATNALIAKPSTDGTASSVVNRQTSWCVDGAEESHASLDIVTADPAPTSPSVGDVAEALNIVQKYMVNGCQVAPVIFAYVKGAAVGVYTGPNIDKAGTLNAAITALSSWMDSTGGTASIAPSITAQLCGPGRNANHVFGVAVGDLTSVQKSVASWNNAQCVDMGNTAGHQQLPVTILEKQRPSVPNNSTTSDQVKRSPHQHQQHHRSRHLHKLLLPRGDCKTVTVVSGDSCWSLSQECGISASDFTKYNPQKDLCSTLAPKQRVCCSAGTLPDVRPKKNGDGSCVSYAVQSGDTCYALAAANGLKIDDISHFNDNTTWGWFGCDKIMAGIKICLSDGDPPMPAPVTNALCGPTVPGTQMPTNGTLLTDLNPCPLNACCDIWGQCGITPEYCTKEPGPTGNPGTAPPGKNGCISNCGVEVNTKNGGGPASFMTVGYYESWNWDRPCLNMRTSSIPTDVYTHVHWGFATIGSDFGVSLNDSYKQFDDFTKLEAKRIVSFGGWGYSTDPATYNVLRTAMSPANVEGFTDNLVNYLQTTGIDGLDFDWEYPGAPDIPGIPAGLVSDGPNYLSFLKMLRKKLPEGKSISIAAPASYWYLRAFPIKDMAAVVDYIVYMTYDLHGQWDYGNQWSQEGCPKGSCLRSHVNMTETMYALAMITKAGVQANKIAVGVSSYGRSFGMTDPGCTGPMCGYGGPDSTATPGKCTGTAGYISNAEIQSIVNINDSSTRSWHDKDSDSNMAVYGGNQWVAYMSDDVKAGRITQYQGLNFGGTVEWAIDLEEFTGDDNDPNDLDDDEDQIADELQQAGGLPDCDNSYATMDDLDADADNIPTHCGVQYMLETLNNVLTGSMQQYRDMIANGYDDKFKTYAGAVADNAGDSVNDFVNKNGNKYFTCVVGETSICCDACGGNNNDGHQCNYCFHGTCYKHCNGITGCANRKREEESLLSGGNNTLEIRDGVGGGEVLISQSQKVDEPCPPDYSKRGYGPDNPYEQTVWWTLIDDKANAFYADLMTTTGIPKDKVKMGDKDRGNDCAPSAHADDTCWYTGMDYNDMTDLIIKDIPMPNGYSAADVTNPKDLVQKALDNSANIADQMADATVNADMDALTEDGYDLIDSVSLPILMIADAVDNMATVVQTADKIDEEKRKAIIMAFIGALLFFVPIAGEVLGSVAELADLGAVIATLGEIGNAAMDVYTVVDDPDNAPLAIISLVFAPLAIADAATIAKAANIRRGMSEEDVAKLGGKIGARMKTIQKITGKCSKSS